MSPFLRLLCMAALAARLAAAEPILQITAPGKTLALTAAEFTALPRAEITVVDPHDQKQHRYAGVAVRELLDRVGVPSGSKLKGAALQLVVLVRGLDGYAVAFALPEFDPAFSDRIILLADQEDGAPLPANAAPLRLITPGDKEAARWVRMVASLDIAPAAAASAAVVPKA
jgi:DMSO/TMAO reductase YedYZ molybdopterin-dependent catalytic subunit